MFISKIKNLKILFVILVFTLSLTIWSSYCFAQEKSTLEKIVKEGVLVVGVNASSGPPACYTNEQGEIVGMIPDLLELYANKLEVDLKLRNISWTGLWSALFDEKIDILAENVTTTVPRTARIAYTVPWLKTGAGFIISSDASFKSKDDFNSEEVTFGGAKGSMWVRKAKKSFPEASWKEYDNVPDSINALKAGRVDVVIGDIVKLSPRASKNANLVMFPEKYAAQTFGWGVRLKDRYLQDSLNIYFREIKGVTGEYDKIYKKWIGSEWNPDYKGYSF